jgi:hypothetical protein
MMPSSPWLRHWAKSDFDWVEGRVYVFAYMTLVYLPSILSPICGGVSISFAISCLTLFVLVSINVVVD